MVNPSYKSLLPPNTDFLNAESGIPNPISLDINTEMAGGGPPEPPNTIKSPEAPKNPDREVLIGALGERIEGFFGMARVRTSRIEESQAEVNKATRSLAEFPDQGMAVTRQLREMPDQRADEVSSLIGQTARKADEQIEDTQRTMRSLDVDGQIADVKTSERNLSGGMETYKQELRDVLKIEDPVQRTAKLDELKARIIRVSQKIDQKAGDSFHTSLTFNDRTKERTAGIPSRLGTAQDMAPMLREKLGESYYRVVRNIGEMADTYSRFRRGQEHIESLPLEFRLLSNAANELGVGVSEIFDAFTKGKYT